jgi:hypothetical protein
VRICLGQLPDAQRQVVYLTFFEDLPLSGNRARPGNPGGNGEDTHVPCTQDPGPVSGRTGRAAVNHRESRRRPKGRHRRITDRDHPCKLHPNIIPASSCPGWPTVRWKARSALQVERHVDRLCPMPIRAGAPENPAQHTAGTAADRCRRTGPAAPAAQTCARNPGARPRWLLPAAMAAGLVIAVQAVLLMQMSPVETLYAPAVRTGDGRVSSCRWSSRRMPARWNCAPRCMRSAPVSSTAPAPLVCIASRWSPGGICNRRWKRTAGPY